MKKIYVITLTLFALSACANTRSGVKSDTSRNIDKTETVLKKGAEKLGQGVQKTGVAIEKLGQ